MVNSGETNPKRKDSLFWNELYWFFAVLLVAWILALFMIPPRALETLALIERERSVLRELNRSIHQEAVQKEAVESFENDPFYRDAVYRNRLQIKKASEEYIERPPPLFR